MRHLLSLRGKMLLFTFGIVVVLTGLSLFVLRAFVARQVQTQIGIELARTQSVFESFMHERADWLQAQCEVVAEDPRFTATLDIITPQFDQQARTVLREARRFQHIIGSDLFMVTNRSGHVLARLVIGPLTSIDALATHAVKMANQVSTYRDGDRVFHVVVASDQSSPRTRLLVLGFLSDMPLAPILSDLQILLQENTNVVQNARQLIDVFDADLAVLIDGDKQKYEALVRHIEYGRDLATSSKIQAALAGVGSVGLQADQEQITQMVVTPVWVGDHIVGTLSVGFGLDDRLAHNLNLMTESDVSFGLKGHVVASTWSPEKVDLVNRHLPIVQQTDQNAPFLMALGDETHLSLLRPLQDLSGDTQGFYLLQLSYDKAIAFLSTAERFLVLMGLSVMLVAALVSFVGISRIIQPVHALVEGTRRVARGDLNARIPIQSKDEIGELSQSFNDMAAELQRSLDALITSERRYRDLFDNAQDIVYTTDMNMCLLSLNKTAQEILERSESDLVGKRFYDLLTPEDARRLEAADRLCTPGLPRQVVEVTLPCHDGQRTFEVMSRWIMSGEQPIGVHGIGRDIQARKEREAATQRFREQLQQAEKLRALGEMSAGVAHNFNNLLTGVLGYAELMKMRDDIPEPVRLNAEKIALAAQRCSAIVRRIQTFGRPIDMSQTKLIDLNAVIRDTIDLTRPRWKASSEKEGRKVEMMQKLGDIPKVRSTASAWEEILSNLIFNAVDAMPKGGQVTIATATETDFVVLCVADTGTGMDAETRSRAFEPFYSTKGPERGTGLGLSTVWGLMQSMGGKIDIETTPGVGTQFILRIPVAEGENQADQKASVLVSGLCILAIDDDPDVREFLPGLLKVHQVDTADSGQAGLMQLAQKKYDVVMTDWAMPGGVSGIEIVEQVKKLSPQTMTILMTGWEIEKSILENQTAIDIVIAKPFVAEELNRALSKVKTRHP